MSIISPKAGETKDGDCRKDEDHPEELAVGQLAVGIVEERDAVVGEILRDEMRRLGGGECRGPTEGRGPGGRAVRRGAPADVARVGRVDIANRERGAKR